MQCHDNTDEISVLLSERCILFVAEGVDRVEQIHTVDMQPLKLYNMKRGTWHTHTLDQEATVLIIENDDSGPANSPEIELSAEQRVQLLTLTHKLWQSQIQEAHPQSTNSLPCVSAIYHTLRKERTCLRLKCLMCSWSSL